MSAPLQKLVAKGATDVSVVLRFLTKNATSFNPAVSLAETASGLVIKYWRVGDPAWVSIEPAAVSFLSSSHTDGGFEPIADGFYRVDLPDAACAKGVGINQVLISAQTTAEYSPGCLIQLVDDSDIAASTPNAF